MNSLRLVERENAWIVKPLDREQPSVSDFLVALAYMNYINYNNCFCN